MYIAYVSVRTVLMNGPPISIYIFSKGCSVRIATGFGEA